MMYKILGIALCFPLVINACQAPKIKKSSKVASEPRMSPVPASSPVNSKKEIADLESEAVGYWKEAQAAANSAKRSFKTINLNVPGDLERSIEIIEQAITVAKIAADLVGDIAKAIRTPKALKADEMADQEVQHAERYLQAALGLKAKIQGSPTAKK